MLIKKAAGIRSSEITDKKTYLSRRRFIALAGAAAAGLAVPDFLAPLAAARAGEKLAGVVKNPLSVAQPPTPLKDITGHNNFYQFGTDKYSPAQDAKKLPPRPWTLAVHGGI